MKFINIKSIKSIEFFKEEEEYTWKIYPPMTESFMWFFSKTSKWRISNSRAEDSIFGSNYYSADQFLKTNRYCKIVNDKIMVKSHIKISYVDGQSEFKYFVNEEDCKKCFSNLRYKLEDYLTIFEYNSLFK